MPAAMFGALRPPDGACQFQLCGYLPLYKVMLSAGESRALVCDLFTGDFIAGGAL